MESLLQENQREKSLHTETIMAERDNEQMSRTIFCCFLPHSHTEMKHVWFVCAVLKKSLNYKMNPYVVENAVLFWYLMICEMRKRWQLLWDVQKKSTVVTRLMASADILTGHSYS